MTATIRKAIKNVTDLFTKEQTEILKTAGLLMIPSLLSKLLGQVYLLLVSTQLGNGTAIADFNTANAIPESITNILLLGIVSAVVIPIFIEAKEKHGDKRFLKVFNTMVTSVMGLFLVVTVALFFFGPQLLSSFTDLEAYPGDVENVLNMMRFLMIPNFILGISMFLTSGLNVYHRILVPQLAPLVFNIGKIFAVLILLPFMNNSPWALVVGILIGSILHLIIQIPLANMLGLNLKITYDSDDKYVGRIVRLVIPRGGAFAAEQIGLLVSKSIVSGVTLIRDFGSVTAISVFSYANALALVIPSLFGYTFAVASFPTISRLFTKKDYQAISSIVADTLNQILFLAIPFTVMLVILRLPAVRLTFGLIPGTAFGREDTVLVAWIVMFLGFGLVFTTAKWYLYRIFYAAQNTVIPLVIALIALAVTVVFAILFTNLLSHSSSLNFGSINWALDNFFSRGNSEAAAAGPAIGITLGTIVEFFLLIIAIHKFVLPMNFTQLFDGLKRKLVPTVVMSLLMYTMFKTWDFLSFPIDASPGFIGSTTVNLIILTGVTVMTSFMVYFLLCYLFKVDELRILRKYLNPLFKLGGLHIR